MSGTVPLCQNPECTTPAHDRFGPLGTWKCFKHGMQFLDDRRIAKQHWPDCALNHGGTECDMGPECGDSCPDGPWCGCDWHRRDEED